MGNYPHFKPTEELHKELSTIRVAPHVKYNINYHIVWIPKYRKKLLGNPKLKRILEDILRGHSEERGWKVLALEIMPDHLHLFLSVPPTVAVAKVVNILKGNTSRQLRLVFPYLKTIVRKSLWADGYYVSTAGFVSQAQVQKYIEAQTKHAKRQEVKQVKEKTKQTRLTAPIPPSLKGMVSLGETMKTKTELCECGIRKVLMQHSPEKVCALCQGVSVSITLQRARRNEYHLKRRGAWYHFL